MMRFSQHSIDELDADDEIFNIALQADGKLVAGGECVQQATGRHVCLARYKVGEPD